MNYRAFDEILETSLDFWEVLPATQEAATVKLIEKEIRPLPKKKTKIWRKGENARFDILPTSWILHWPNIASFQIEHTSKQLFVENHGADIGTLRIFTLSEAFGLLLFQKGCFLLHGSAIQLNNTAHVFVGVPGAGKSTTATAFWQSGHTLLSDDLVAIKFIDNQPFVIPAFPQLKVWKTSLDGLGIPSEGLANSFEGIEKYVINQPFTTFPQQPIPLERITILQKPRSTKPTGNISPIQAPIELVKHFPLPNQLLQRDFLKKHFEQSLNIAKNCQIVSQKRPKDFETLRNFVANYQ